MLLQTVCCCIQRVPPDSHRFFSGGSFPPLRKISGPPASTSVTLGEAFGDVLRELRYERGDSQETVAWRVDLNRPYLSELENGKKVPSLTTIFRLAEALSTEPENLVARAKEKKRKHP